MKYPLKSLVIASTGYFGEDRDDKKIKNWVEVNGGSFSKEITNDVTHLVCSKDHFKKQAPKVVQALNFPEIKIVSFDWLEDSLWSRFSRATGDYLLSRLTKNAAKRKRMKKEIRKQNEKAASGYHVYRDDTGFEYSIALSRLDHRLNSTEQYQVRLYESHGAPNLYACYATRSLPIANRSITQIVSPLGTPFDVAFAAFTSFFTEKTMVLWDERLEENYNNTNPLAYEYLKPQTGPYGRLPGDEETMLEERLGQESLIDESMGNGSSSSSDDSSSEDGSGNDGSRPTMDGPLADTELDETTNVSSVELAVQ